MVGGGRISRIKKQYMDDWCKLIKLEQNVNKQEGSIYSFSERKIQDGILPTKKTSSSVHN